MNKTKIAVALEPKAVQRLDRLVRQRVFPNRNRAVQAALGYMAPRQYAAFWRAGGLSQKAA